MPDGLAQLPTGEATIAGESSLAGSDGQDQPGTPDQQDDQPATPNAAQAASAAAARAAEGGAAHNSSSSGGSNSPDLLCGGEEGLAGAAGIVAGEAAAVPQPPGSVGQLGGAAGLASFQARPPGLAALGAAPQAPLQVQPTVGGLSAPLDLPPGGGSGGAPASLFAEPAPTTAGSSLFGSPAMVGGLLVDSASPHSARLGSSLPTSMAGSPFMPGMAGETPAPARRPACSRSVVLALRSGLNAGPSPLHHRLRAAMPSGSQQDLSWL